MPRTFILAVFVLTAACSREEQQNAQLMDEVERQVQLPNGAQPLDDYARFYLQAPDGDIIGLYVLPRDARSSSDDSEELDPTQGLRPGERRWVDDHRYLPKILDGGCMVVNVVYNPATAEVEKAFCNGVA